MTYLSEIVNGKRTLTTVLSPTFEKEYDAFLGTLIGNINHKSWDAISLVNDPQIQTDSFFEKYELYFEERPLEN